MQPGREAEGQVVDIRQAKVRMVPKPVFVTGAGGAMSAEAGVPPTLSGAFGLSRCPLSARAHQQHGQGLPGGGSRSPTPPPRPTHFPSPRNYLR
jgi:hypothetical protein